jgi:chloramphenicol 3-O phosphotransferase
MNAAISTYSRHGQSVIFDTALSNPESWRYVLEDLAELPVYLVGITCDAEELSRRERERGDRELGLAARQSKWIHANKEYDLLIDSTISTPEQCATEVVGWLRNNPVPHAFNTMRVRLGVA